ncbi:MAG TPA: dihydroorotase [Acidimicrobiia bacterium]|nr:dihydroorotase [Acidimicrobiia bacterium]
MIIIRSGEVLTADGWRTADVTVDGDVVTGVGSGSGADVEIDARGCLVGPAFVDLHAHLRDPGQTWKEDLSTGSRAAAAGGFAAVVVMPNTDPPIDTPKLIEEVKGRGAEVGLVEVVPAGALTVGRSGATPADVTAMYRSGARLFTDDGDSVADEEVLRRLMKEIAGLPGAVVAQHAEDAARTADGHLHEGRVSRRLGVAGMPAEAEADVVARDLEIVAETGARYHCQHVSSRMTVELIATAKKRRLPVTAEVTPHHLTFDERDLAGLDTDYKMYPPLRGDDDRSALVNALIHGIIDAVATDHAPHTAEEKDVPFATAPRGVIGLETAASATWQALGDRDIFFRVLSMAPARIAGLTAQGRPVEPGAPANLVVFHPAGDWVPTDFHSRSANSPWKGRRMRGVVKATLHDGIITHGGEGPG